VEVPPPAPLFGHRHADPWCGDRDAAVVFVLRRHWKSGQAGLIMRVFVPISAISAFAGPGSSQQAVGLMADGGGLRVRRKVTALVVR